MPLNFKEALALLSRALPQLLSCAAAYVGAGLLILLEFGLLLFTLRLAGVSTSGAMLILPILILLGGWLTLQAWQRFFLYRRQTVMLFLFSGMEPPRAATEAGRVFPSFSGWARDNRRLRRALRDLGPGSELPAVSFSPAAVFSRLAQAHFSRAIMALAFSRIHAAAASALGVGLALYWRHGAGTRRLARRWLGFSLAGWALLFSILALANGFIFHSAGVPVLIGVTLAAVIAWTLYQAFIAPLALAGVCQMLLAETEGHEPDPALCEKIEPLLTA